MGTVHRWYCIPDDIWLYPFKTASRASAFYGYNLICKCISWLLWMFDRTGWSANSMVAPTYIVYINQFFMILTATGTTLGTLITLNNCTTYSAVLIFAQPLLYEYIDNFGCIVYSAVQTFTQHLLCEFLGMPAWLLILWSTWSYICKSVLVASVPCGNTILNGCSSAQLLLCELLGLSVPPS